MTGRSLKVNLVANTLQFKTAMTQTSNQMKLINSEFKSVAAETDKYGNKLDQTAAKKKQLSGIIEQYKSRITAIKNEQKHWTAELRKGNITETEHAKKQQELAVRLNNTESQMKRYEGQLKRINATGKETSRTYADFDRQFRKVGETLRSAGIQAGITAGIGFMAMKRALSDVAGEAISFESGLSKVKAVSGATTAEMKEMKSQAMDLGAKTSFSAQQAAEGMEKLALAGWKSAEIMAAMPGMLDLAAAGALELSEAADITSDVMSAFGMSADKAGHAADVFAYAQANANTNVSMMGEAMTYLAPVANALGWELEESAAAVMKLADSGVKGSMAGQAFGTSLSRLAKPTKAMNKEMKRLDMSFFDAQGNIKPMPDLMKEVEKGTKGMTNEQKSSTLSILFGAEAYKHWAILLESGSEELARTTEELKNADGAAADMAETMLDNAHGAIVRMESAISGLKIQLGDKLLPVISEAADFVSDLATKLGEMDEETLNTIAQTALLVTAVLGVTTVVSGLVAGLGAFMMVAGPVGLAIAGGTLLLGGLAAALYKSSLDTKRLAEEQAKAKSDAISYGEGLSEGTLKGVKGYTDLYEGAKIKMLDLKTMTGKEADATVEEVRKSFAEMGNVVVAELEQQKDKLTKAMNEVLGAAGDAGAQKADELTTSVIANIDEDIAKLQNAQKKIDEVLSKYGNDMSKMPKHVRREFNEALSVVESGTEAFAQTQGEMRAIQSRIAAQDGAIMADQAQGFIKNVNDTYRDGIVAINDYRNDKTELFDQALAHDRLSVEEHALLMQGVDAKTNEMLAEVATERALGLNLLSDNLEKRGELIDLATGEEFKKKEEWMSTANGYMYKQEESEAEYRERWLAHNAEVVDGALGFSEQALKVSSDFSKEFLIGLGLTEEQAISKSEELTSGVLKELSSRTDEANKAGQDKGDAVAKGLDSKKGNVEGSADSLSLGAKYKLESTTDGGGGAKAGNMFVDGIDSQKGNANKVAINVAESGKRGLGSVSTTSTGMDFVSGFRNSIASGSVWNVAWNLGKSALRALKKSIDSNSPSEETGKLGDDFGDGFTLSILKNKKQSINAAAMVGKESVEALNKEVKGFKQSFGAIALAVEGNKQTLKVEHTLDKKFDEFASMFKSMNETNSNESSLQKLLEAMLRQNDLIMQLLQKDNTATLAFENVYQPIKKRLAEDQYGLRKGRNR